MGYAQVGVTLDGKHGEEGGVRSGTCTYIYPRLAQITVMGPRFNSHMLT
jgi:hypothetical protein